MCGIAGIVRPEPAEIPAAVIRRMTAAIDHRGPDAEGFYAGEGVALGHRRLSIIDLHAGRQPMSNEDGTLWTVYNGEIFNHDALRADLARAGHRYRTRCDTETILHAYEEYGPACVERFRGMFAFALWDTRSRTLFCARDRLGIKPFYYFWDGRLFAFASEIKALLQHPEISPRFHEDALPEYLAFGYTGGDETLFAGIRKLMPGHTLSLDCARQAARPEIRRYWDVPAPSPAALDERAWVAECRRRLEETVRMRLMSDVPLGMFLSGGVDSSAIAAMMKRATSGPVKTFAVGYREAAFSELAYAREVAEAIGTDHHEVVVGRDDFFGALPRLIWHEDEPIVWPSSVSLYFVSRLAAEHVKVVLTGEGSDELFGGYGRYRFCLWNLGAYRFYRFVPPPLRRAVRAAVDGSPWLSGSVRRKLRHTFLACGDGLASLYLDNFYCAFSSVEQARLLLRPARGRGPYDPFLGYWESAAGRGLLGRMLYADQKTYLVELLMKQDQMSMAASIESRVPFLDHPLVEFAASIPDSLKIRRGAGKRILKRAVEDLLPPGIVYRKKMGFPTPLRRWLAEPAAGPLLEGLCARRGLLPECLDLAAVRALLDRHRAGLEDATDRIWRLLNLQLWGEIFLAGNAAAPPPPLHARAARASSTAG